MEPGEVVDGRFEIVALAGSGGMGSVFRALDRLTGQPVALKLLQRGGAHELGRTSREAQALAMLRLPGVVRYIGHGVAATGQPYLAMDWLPGDTLQERLARRPFSIDESVALATRVAETLGAIHRLGLVHRDLKPSNLMLVDGEIDRVMLIDFGIVRDMMPAEPSTAAGHLMGTPGYIAPEYVQGERVDARADVFALGCVLFECVSGRAAFVGDDPISLLARVVLEQPPRLRDLRSDCPEWLERLVARMLAKGREHRPRDGDAVAAALAASEYASTSRPALSPWAEPGGSEITASERRVMALLLVEEGALDADATLDAADDDLRARAVRDVVEAHGGRLELLQAQWMLAVLPGGKSPTELAMRAARCAHAVDAAVDGASMAVVIGRAEVAGGLPVGQIIDRAVRLLPRGKRPEGPAIRIDEVMAGLLGPRFATAPDGEGIWLRDAVADGDRSPQLLGKPTPFVGRDREVQTLLGELGRCVEQRAAMGVLVTAPAGIGKSRLLQEFLRASKERGDEVEVWLGQADPMSAGSAFGLVAHALRRAMGIVEGEPIEARRERVRARVARHARPEVSNPDRAARVATFLGELVGVPFADGGDVQLRVARRSAMVMGDQIRQAFEDFVRAECASRPVLLVLEDLHWGDLPTVSLLEAALRHAHDLPLMVLALGRPEVQTLFPKLWKERCSQVVHLAPLTRRASERIVREALGDGAPADFAAQLVARADGNPFFLEEQIRAAADGRTQGLPETVLATVQARLDLLEVEARRVLRAASIFGERFRGEGVEALLGGAEAGSWLRELERRELVVWGEDGRPAGESDYRFRHALVREAAYGMLTERDRRLGHALAGEWLERAGGGDAMALAEHFVLGGTPVRAAAAYLRAAEEALRGNDLDAAIERADRGVACGPEREVLGALRSRQAEAHLWRGEMALAERRGLEAMAHLARGTAAWLTAATQVLNAMGMQGAGERIDPLLDQVIAAPVAEGALAAKHICLSEGATRLIFAGSYPRADALLETVERSIAEAGTPEAEVSARLHQARAFRTTPSSSAEACMAAFQDAHRDFERAGDRRNACTAQMNVGFCHAELGDFASAESALRAALADAERMALHEVNAWILQNLSLVLAHGGKIEEGRAAADAALAAARRMTHPRLEGAALAYLARIALVAGDMVSAERDARAAAEVLESAPPLRAHAMAVLARALLGLGRAEEAHAAALDAHGTLESLGSIDEGESLVRLVYAEALAGTGDSAAAAVAVAAARNALMSRAGTVRDPLRRERFLQGIPENARTLELARAWLSEDARGPRNPGSP